MGGVLDGATTADVLAELLRRHRQEAGLTQRELADRVGLSLRTLRDMERGRIRHPRARSLHRLAAVLPLNQHERSLLSSVDTAATRDSVRVCILGPLTVSVKATGVDIRPAMQRGLLGLLALRYGE